jgi:hypothetical protein
MVSVIILPASGSKTQVISNDQIIYFMDLAESRELIIAGHTVLIESASALSVKYQITKPK